MSTKISQFVGSGIVFPLNTDENGKPRITTGFELVEASLKTILSWHRGTRFMLGEFGSRIEEVLEEPNDDIAYALVKEYTVQAISLFEKRVELLDLVILERNAHILKVQLDYKIKNTNLQNTLIFPYYSVIPY